MFANNAERGLPETAGIVCDAITAESLPQKCSVIPFLFVAHSSIEELKCHQEFLKDSSRVVTLQEV